MTVMGASPGARKPFQAAVELENMGQKTKSPSPFSIRFSWDERAHLVREAGTLSLAAHIRLKLFGDVEPSLSNRMPSRKPQRPKADKTALAQVLGALGQSGLATSLNELSKAANAGALPVTPETVEQLHTACADIRLIRRTLIKALGIKADNDA